MSKINVTEFDNYEQLDLNLILMEDKRWDYWKFLTEKEDEKTIAEHKNKVRAIDYSGYINIIEEVYSGLSLEGHNQRIAKNYIKLIILNIAFNYNADKKRYTGFHLNEKQYNPKSRYNKNQIGKTIIKIAWAMHKAEFIVLRRGYNNKYNPEASYNAKLSPTKKLIDLMKKNKLNYNLVTRHPEEETIVVKIKKGKNNVPIEYEDTEEILSYRKLMVDYNNLLANTHIDVYARKNDGIKFGKVETPIEISQNRKFVRRIFNSPDLSLGGRIYGGFWQQLNSEYRDMITIDGQQTIEIDYSGMGIALLYDKYKIKRFVGDAYNLSSVGYKHKKYSMEELRPLLKQALIIMVNAKSYQECINAIRKDVRENDELPGDVNIEELISAFVKRHEPIRHLFYTSQGGLQQNLDSEVCCNIIAYFMYNYEYKYVPDSETIHKGNIPVLTIHDSFLIAQEHEAELKKQMEGQYRFLLKLKRETKIKTKTEYKEAIKKYGVMDIGFNDEPLPFNNPAWKVVTQVPPEQRYKIFQADNYWSDRIEDFRHSFGIDRFPNPFLLPKKPKKYKYKNVWENLFPFLDKN